MGQAPHRPLKLAPAAEDFCLSHRSEPIRRDRREQFENNSRLSQLFGF
jgi:hypothetical protein